MKITKPSTRLKLRSIIPHYNEDKLLMLIAEGSHSLTLYGEYRGGMDIQMILMKDIDKSSYTYIKYDCSSIIDMLEAYSEISMHDLGTDFIKRKLHKYIHDLKVYGSV